MPSKKGGKKKNPKHVNVEKTISNEETELKKVNEHLKNCQNKAKETKEKWDNEKQKEETLQLECKELQKSIQKKNNQILSVKKATEQYQQQFKTLIEDVVEAQKKVQEVEKRIKNQKEMESLQNKNKTVKVIPKGQIKKAANETQLEIQELEQKLAFLKIKAEAEQFDIKLPKTLFKDEPSSDDGNSKVVPVKTAKKINKREAKKPQKNVNNLEKAQDQDESKINTSLESDEDSYVDLEEKHYANAVMCARILAPNADRKFYFILNTIFKAHDFPTLPITSD